MPREFLSEQFRGITIASYLCMKVINLETFRLKKTEKNQTWLYSISFDELFNEFINTFNKFELDPQCMEIHAWLDQVSDALNERFYNKKTE